MYSVPLQLNYDPNKLQLVNVSNGGFLSQDGQAVALVHREDETVGNRRSRPRGHRCGRSVRAGRGGDADLPGEGLRTDSTDHYTWRRTRSRDAGHHGERRAGFGDGAIVSRSLKWSKVKMVARVQNGRGQRRARLHTHGADRRHDDPIRSYVMALPLARVTIQREKEKELRKALWEMRDAIDRYKDAADRGA